MLHSSLVDFLAQLFAFVESCATPEYPVEIKVPHVDELLDDIAYSKPERVDVAIWLLENGATVQRKPSPGKVQTRRSRAWYGEDILLPEPLRSAVESGNERMLRLFLERGADSSATDFVVLQHIVKRGRLSILRLLVEHGAEVPREDSMADTRFPTDITNPYDAT